MLVGVDGMVCARELDVDNNDFPPDRVRGFGGGGFTRVDDDLDSVPEVETAGIDSEFAFSVPLFWICGEASASGGFVAPSMIGSDTDRRLTDDKFELLLPSVVVIGCCETWPVNINCLNASASKDCRLLPVAANGLLTEPPPTNVDMANDSVVSPEDIARGRNGFGDAEALLTAVPVDDGTGSFSVSDVSYSSALKGSCSASWSTC